MKKIAIAAFAAATLAASAFAHGSSCPRRNPMPCAGGCVQSQECPQEGCPGQGAGCPHQR